MPRRWSSMRGAFGVALLLVGGWTSLRASGDCDPDQLTAAIEACGLDLACINRVSVDYQTRCVGGQPAPPPQGGGGGMGGMGGMGGEAMQRLMQCGSDQACYERVMNEMMNPGGGGGPSQGPSLQQAWDPEAPDTTPRIAEQTMLPASWLQTHQEAYVACGKDIACWGAEQSRGFAKVRATCGSNMFNEWTVTCTIAAQHEANIEQAIAMQRLWRRGIRFEGGGPGSTPGQSPPPGTTPPGTTPPATTPPPQGETSESWDFLRTVTRQQVMAVLDRWDGNLRGALPQPARDRLKASAEAYPLEAEEGAPELYFEEVEGPEGLTIRTRPSRRDHAYALAGVLLTQASMVQEGQKQEVARDAAFWCAIQATKQKQEVSHLSQVGFHLNLRAALEDAGTVLTYARQLEPDDPDVNNNLAFTESGRGRSQEAKQLQRHAYRNDPSNGQIRSRLDAMVRADERPPRGVDPDAPMPHGGDFGEAYFRLAKRHQLREYWANKEWQKARDRAKAQAWGGGSKPINGPWEVYQKRLKAIAQDYSRCSDRAPKILVECQLPGYDPRCKGAPSHAQVVASRQAHERFMCQCRAVNLQQESDAQSALVDGMMAVWEAHETKWRPRLRHFLEHWRPDIQAVNARYQGSNFHFPEESAYTQWPEEFQEDSEDYWDEVEGAQAKWRDLKSSAQSLKACPPPPLESPKQPKKTPPPEPKKVRKYEVDLGIVKFSLTMDGDFDFEADLGFLKLGYGYRAGQKGHKFTVGSGPVDFSYQHNGAPGPGGSRHQISGTASANFFKFVPGAGKFAAGAMDQVYSLGGKYQVNWSSTGGISGKPIWESQSKWGMSESTVHARSARTLN